MPNCINCGSYKRKPRPRLWVGKKTKEWIAVRARLKRKLFALGIVTCEFNLSKHCTPDNFLSLAHSKKRRFCATLADLEEVAIACFSCHRVLDEQMTHENMYKAVTDVIRNRTIKF